MKGGRGGGKEGKGVKQRKADAKIKKNGRPFGRSDEHWCP